MSPYWRFNGSNLVFSMTRSIIETVLPYVDRYIVVSRSDTGDVLELVRRDVKRARDNLEIWYTLPAELFDCSARTIVANCLLLEDGEARLDIGPMSRDGEAIVPASFNDDQILGAVEYFDGERIRGWVIDKDAVDKSVQLGIFIDNVLSTVVKPNDMRRDILRRFGGTGLCGFNVQLPNMLFDGQLRVLCCAPISSLRPLRNGLVNVDRQSIEDHVIAHLRDRFARLERLLE